MGKAPVWYPGDPSDWRGRGVKDISERIIAKMEELGVEFMPEELAKGNPNARQNLMKYRNRNPRYD